MLMDSGVQNCLISTIATLETMDKDGLSRIKESVYLNEYFNFDPKANKMEDKVFACRAIITNEEFWDAMQDGLYDTLNEAWSVILFQMGLRYGSSVGEKARESVPEVQQAIKFLESYGLMAGWGRFKTAQFNLSEGKLPNDVKVAVEDNFFAKTGKKKKWETPRCFFVAGLLAGIAEGLLGEGHNCIETKCIANGAQACEFLISRRNI